MKFSFTVFQRFSFPFFNDFLVCLAVWFFWFHLKRLSIILVSEFIFMAFINFWWKTNKQTNKTERLWGERLDRSCLRSWYETVSHFILGWTNMKDSILRMNFILFANWEEKKLFLWLPKIPKPWTGDFCWMESVHSNSIGTFRSARRLSYQQ